MSSDEIMPALPELALKRFRRLVKRRRQAKLTPEELEELCGLSDQFEVIEARRVEKLIELARLRSVTLPELMRQLGIRPIRSS
jgi:pantothenate kinase